MLERVHPSRGARDLGREPAYRELERSHVEQPFQHRLEALRDRVDARCRSREAVAATGPCPGHRLLRDLDDPDPRDVPRAQAQLDLALGGERRRLDRLEAVGGDGEAEEPPGVRSVAVEHIERLEGRGAEVIELAHQRAASLLEQVPPLGRESDLGLAGEQLAPGRAHRCHQGHRGPPPPLRLWV